jgi:NAD(P)-dependent dehydrogenase (short-subunit alcohol dehydrogenase family)
MTTPAHLSGKRTLVTGGSKGIGFAIAQAFSAAGARVALTSRTLADAERAAREIGGECLPLACDVSDAGQTAAMRDALTEAWDGLDILINNAGISGSHKFVTHPDELWHAIISVNLTGVYYVTKAFAPGMLAQGWGRIVNIASTAAKAGGKYIAAYAASKHGVLGLTRSLAIELAPHVTANAICPGYVDTPMTDASIANIAAKTGMTPQEARATLEGHSPRGRLVQPAEVAAVALRLAQSNITGRAITVDGGEIRFEEE